jgi:hypothetical protein
MRFRKLRIAWSVAWGIACVLLIVFWVRSYWYLDTGYCQLFQSPTIAAMSVEGRFLIGVEQPGSSGTQLGFGSRSLKAVPREVIPMGMDKSKFGFNAKTYAIGWILEAPPCSIVGIGLFAVAVPWIRWPKHFTLRTLLIATTLVAVVLGLIVWLRR